MYVIKVVMSAVPNMSEQQRMMSMNYLINSTGFVGVIPGNPSYTLWETEADANAFVPYSGLNEAVNLVTTTEIMPLEESGKSEEDFKSWTNNNPN